MKVLKQYKSCADCYNYEWGSMGDEDYCTFGYPLEKLKETVTRSVVVGDPCNDLDYNHKPKYGCLQKNYRNCPKFDFNESMAEGIRLTQKDMDDYNNNLPKFTT